jgi:hypothetical protein
MRFTFLAAERLRFEPRRAQQDPRQTGVCAGAAGEAPGTLLLSSFAAFIAFGPKLGPDSC